MISKLNGERVIIAALVSAKDATAADRLDRLEGDLDVARATVVGRLVQRRGVSRASTPGGASRMNAPMNPATVIGTGKVRELAQLAAEHQATVIVFVNRLTPSQLTKLELATGCRVVSADAIPT